MGNGVTPGTIAVLNHGGIIPELSQWLSVQKETWPGRLLVLYPRGNQIARQRNMAVERLHGDWLLFIDSDCVPWHDTLTRLVSSNLPVVGGVYYERSPILRDGHVVFPIAASRGGEKLLDADVKVSHGIIPVTTAGTGCLLIRRHVFETMPSPWFRCGQLDTQYLDEDSEFCLRAAACNFTVYLDCAVRIGHRVEGVVWPGRDGRRWIQWHSHADCREPLVDESRAACGDDDEELAGDVKGGSRQ